jgi:uncharacterized delta-60 repeat protein
MAHSLQQTSDGGFIVAGETYSFGAVNSDEWVFKLDANGSIQWQKAYGGIGYDMARSIQQTSDGGYIVAGETSSFGGNTEVWILKLDGNGTIQWQNRYGGSEDDAAHSIQQTSDGGYIVAGETTSFGAGGADAFVFKLKSNGSMDWQKSYGGTNDDRARSIQQTSDGGFIVAGETNSFAAGGSDIWVWKLDATGAVVWQKTYGRVNDDAAYSVQQTSDGGYILAGGTTPAGSSLNDVFLLKLDASGGVVWQKTYGGVNDDAAYSVQQASDGGYIIAGKTSSFGNLFGDIWILKVNANGEIDWQKAYGGNGSNSANFIRQISDGRYIVAGETSYFAAGDADVCVLELESNGEIGSGSGLILASNATTTPAGFTEGNSSAADIVTTAAANPTSISPRDSGATTTSP